MQVIPADILIITINLLLLYYISGHGYELVAKLSILKQRIDTYSKQPCVQYYLNLQPGSDHNLTDLRLQLAELAQMHADMERRLVEEAAVGMDLVSAGLVQAAGEGNDKGNGKERHTIKEVNPVWMETVRRCTAVGVNI